MSAKREIVAILEELRELVTLEEKDPQSFRVRAYERACAGLRTLHVRHPANQPSTGP